MSKSLQFWLWIRLIDGFFWEVDRHDDYVTIQVIV